MNKLFTLLFCACIALTFNSCEKDKGLLPAISFKTGSIYVSTDTSIAQGTAIKIGIDASKTENEDVLKKFTISKSINGGTAVTVYTVDLTGGEANNYSYDYNTVLESVAGQNNKYTFTVTNRDGLVNQVSLTVSIL